MLPDKWHSGLKARIEWGITPNTVPLPPLYKDWDKYQAWEKNSKKVTFNIPQLLISRNTVLSVVA
ncbi:DUF3304 domain-containing protein [Escherichia coli]|uniref:DUF3304 domain-containing protein n=1 Tax=Escherichia coli TaxID=562 RepID=UPI00330619F9